MSPDPVEARIARVEQGLSTPVVVRGRSGQTMKLQDRMAFHHVPAVSIALIDQGTIAWVRAYGATPDTRFQAASVSKTVSAVGAMALVQRGRVSLDAPANAQLSTWKVPASALTRTSPVTLRRLLNHSAGTTVHGYDGYNREQPLPTLLETLQNVQVEAVPGTGWRYSGGGFSVVQLMVQEAAGETFERYMQRAVLTPLGMRHSHFAVEPLADQQAHSAQGHTADGQPIAGGWRVYPESAAAGLWTTPYDLAQVVLEIQRAAEGASGRVLSHDSARAVLTRGQGEYGLGLYVENLGQQTSFSHSGGTAGYRAQLYGYTPGGQGVVIMTNSDNGAALIDEILASVSAEYGWPEFKVIEKEAMAGDASRNRALAGRYRLLDAAAELVADGERLHLRSDALGGQPRELFAQSETTFFMVDQDMTVAVARRTDGTVSGFSLVRGANVYEATRVP